MNRNDKGNLLMMSVVLIVVGGLAFTVVMQAVAYDVLAVRANRAELAAANALTSGVNIVTSDIRRYGPSHYPADPLVIDRYPGDPYCDEGCWTVGLSPPSDRGVDLRGAGQVSTLAVWEATIYAASECQAEPPSSPPVPFPGIAWWDEFDCLITDTTTLRFEPDPLPLYTLIIAEQANPCPFSPPPAASAACLAHGSTPLTVSNISEQVGLLVLETTADPVLLCGTLGDADVHVGGAGSGGVTGDCDTYVADVGSGEISWVWDLDGGPLDLANDLTTNACVPSPVPALYRTIDDDWEPDDMFTGSLDWTTGNRHQTTGSAVIDLREPDRLTTNPHTVLALETVTIQGSSPNITAPTLVVFAGCNIILDTTSGWHFDNVLLVAANSVWSSFGFNVCGAALPTYVTGTIISGRTPFTFNSDTSVTPTVCTGSPLQAEIPPDWSSEPVAYWPDRPYPWRRS